MNGKELELAVKLDDRSATQIAKELDISRTQLYDLFKSDNIGSNYLKKFEEINLRVTKLDKSKESHDNPEESVEFLKAQIFLMEQNRNDLKELIDTLKANVEDLRTNNQTLNKLVNKQLG